MDDGCKKSIVCVLDVIKELFKMFLNFFFFSGLYLVLLIMMGYEYEYYECIDCILMIFYFL